VLPALRDPRLAAGLWLMALAGTAFGVVDVLAPLRLSRLGADSGVIAAAFLCSALLESGVAPLTGRFIDRFGARWPVIIGLAAGTLFGAVIWLPASLAWLIPILVLGQPFFGSLYTPAAILISASADEQKLNQGIASALTNLTWAAGQAIAASSTGALAEATADRVPYLLLGGACLLTLGGVVRSRLAQPRSAS
jgi:MFS family permease